MEKLYESITSEQNESEESVMNIDIEESAEDPNKAVKFIREIDKMIKIKKNNILMIAYHQGKIFRKFKTDNKFISAVSALKISTATINFKIDIVEFIDNYRKMEKSCISFYYLKTILG